MSGRPMHHPSWARRLSQIIAVVRKWVDRLELPVEHEVLGREDGMMHIPVWIAGPSGKARQLQRCRNQQHCQRRTHARNTRAVNHTYALSSDERAAPSQ